MIMNFSLNPFINEFDSISSPSDLYSSNDDISEVFLDILFQDKQDVNENNIKIRLEPFFKVEKDKNLNDLNRGRRKKQNKSIIPFETSKIKGIHGNKSFDNLERKIQVHYIRFIINFSNDALKSEKNLNRCTFKQIDTRIKETINYKQICKLRKSSIGDILQNDLSDKYKRYDKSENRKLFKKVVSSSEWLRELFKMNYLELFNYYYNEKEPLAKIMFKGKEIIISPKTKSFYYLLEKNVNLRTYLISTVNSIYFDGNEKEPTLFTEI